MRALYRAVPCSCGDQICKHWHVSGVAQREGVSFTEDQAHAVAFLLNFAEESMSPTINAGDLPAAFTRLTKHLQKIEDFSDAHQRTMFTEHDTDVQTLLCHVAALSAISGALVDEVKVLKSKLSQIVGIAEAPTKMDQSA